MESKLLNNLEIIDYVVEKGFFNDTRFYKRGNRKHAKAWFKA